MQKPELLSRDAEQSPARLIGEMSRLYFLSRAIQVAAEPDAHVNPRSHFRQTGLVPGMTVITGLRPQSRVANGCLIQVWPEKGTLQSQRSHNAA